MKNWIQIPLTDGEELNIKKKVSSRLINMERIDELLLDVSGSTGKITALKGGESEVLCTGDPQNVTGIWADLLCSLEAESVDFSGSEKAGPVNFRFPHAGRDDVPSIVNTFLIKTDAAKTDDVPEEQERLFLSFVFGYICTEAPAREQDFSVFNEFLNAFEIREGDANFKNAVDLMLEEKEEKAGNTPDVENYKKFKQLSVSKQKRVLRSCRRRIKSLGFQSGDDEPEEEPASAWGGCSNW